MASLVGNSSIKGWAVSVGILPERMDRIIAAAEAKGITFSLDASPTADATLIAALRPHFNAEGYPNEVADRFITAMNVIGPSNGLLNAAVVVPNVQGTDKQSAAALAYDNSMVPVFVESDATGFGIGITAEDQSPASAGAALPGATVTVSVSIGDEVPDVTSLTVAAATTAIEADSFVLGDVDEVADVRSDPVALDECEADDDIFDTIEDHGLVVDQLVYFSDFGENEGTGITQGAPYFVIAANLAAKTFQVRDEVGGEAAVFSSNITEGNVTLHRAGLVQSQSIEGHGEPGATIDLTVAGVTLPSLGSDTSRRQGYGTAVADWVASIVALGLVEGTPTEDTEDDCWAGVVTESDPAAGTIVALGTTVDYTHTSSPLAE